MVPFWYSIHPWSHIFKGVQLGLVTNLGMSTWFLFQEAQNNVKIMQAWQSKIRGRQTAQILQRQTRQTLQNMVAKEKLDIASRSFFLLPCSKWHLYAKVPCFCDNEPVHNFPTELTLRYFGVSWFSYLRQIALHPQDLCPQGNMDHGIVQGRTNKLKALKFQSALPKRLRKHAFWVFLVVIALIS